MKKTYPRVHINEEVMREGMQIESAEISVDDKVRLLDALSQTGLKRIVVGSFVSPRYTPQMARIDEVVQRFAPAPGVSYTAVTLNAKGVERARAHAPKISPDQTVVMGKRVPLLFTHMCDTFVRRNANVSQEQEIMRWESVVSKAVADGETEAAIGLGAAFGSNFQGDFTTEERMSMLRRQHAAWTRAGIPVRRLALADPMAWVKPWVVEEMLEAVLREWPLITHFALHLHNARGLALPSMYEALRILDDRHDLYVETTAGGIGGCPYCGTGRATGMVATEDLVNMLEQMGIPTGVDLRKLIQVVWMLEQIIGRTTPGFVSKAGPHVQGKDLFDSNLPFVETHDEARHFMYGPSVVEHQLRPWRDPIPPAARAGREVQA